MGLNEFLLVVAVGGGIVAVLAATFRGAARDAETRDRETAGAGVPPELAAEMAELEDRRAAALRSLEEIEADFEAGNLSGDDYESLRERYESEAGLLAQSLKTRIGEARRGGKARATSDRPAAAQTPAGSRWPNAVGWAAGLVAFAALAWLVMSNALQPRGSDGSITGGLPGQPGGMPTTSTTAPIAEVDGERLAELEKIVAADSSNVAAMNELAHLYLTLQRYGEVTQLSTKVLERDSRNPEALTHLGMVLVAVDHLAEGLASFDRALEIDPEFAEALQFKGMVSFINQDYAAAVEAWERYLEVAPSDASVDRIRGMLEMARQNAAAGDTARP